ncbi:hypothetical protein KC19_2G169900 [Ceratodon purpureus]|uniref:Complex 1 LYR protein domain-containing protein n=1 Tax=Ceratodon purpureus TaxID=3225 RepID=A0A8T0IXT6_CERPU|nr:hypothetical protein KC19_2G169900 [Ceratodon purpureus]
MKGVFGVGQSICCRAGGGEGSSTFGVAFAFARAWARWEEGEEGGGRGGRRERREEGEEGGGRGGRRERREEGEEGASMSMSMGGAVKQAYREVLKLIKRLPPQSQGYYSQYARENFITYSEPQDAATVRELLARAHRHSCWILNKYGVNEAAANKLKEICLTDHVQNPA